MTDQLENRMWNSQGSKMTDAGQVVPLSWRVCLEALGSAWWSLFVTASMAGPCNATQTWRSLNTKVCMDPILMLHE